MSRRANIEPSTKLTLMLPESVRARLDLALWSDLEGRVPQGRYQEFFITAIQRMLEWKQLAPGREVFGAADEIEALRNQLKGTL